MKFLVRNILYILYIILAYSCTIKSSSSDVKVININTAEVENNYIFDEFDFIKLETTDECLLEDVVKVKLYDENYYILSTYGGNIYKFDKTGKYINKLKQGNGPGELLFVTDFYIDEQSDKIYVFDVYNIIKKYDLDGTYINEEKLDTPFFSLMKVGNDLMLFDSNTGRRSDYHLTILNTEDGTSFKLLEKNNLRNVPFLSDVFTPVKDDFLISYMISDTIYYYKSATRELKPKYCVNFSSPSIYNIKEVVKNGREFNDICKKNEYVIGFSSLSQIADNIYFTFTYQKQPIYVKYNTMDNKVNLFSKLANNLPNSTQLVGRNDNTLIYSYDISILIEYFNENPSSVNNFESNDVHLDENDNPILVIFKN